MAIHGKLKRFFLIIEKVNRGFFPTLQEMQDYLYSHGFDVPRRTFVRDLSEIRLEFGIEIGFNRSRKGYFIDKEMSLNFDSITKLLQTAISTEAILGNLEDSKMFINYVDYGSEVELKGMEYFEQLLRAIKECKHISFDHENYNSGTIKPYQLCPYLLKEYQKRWYVIGTVSGTEDIRTFGIDRIENLKVEMATFKRNEALNPKPYFSDIIGLNYSDYEVEKVELLFSPLQAKYLKAYPLHKSQVVLEETEQFTKLGFKIKPNYEFQERVMMFGKNVTVLQPSWLREHIQQNLKEALAGYN